MPRTSNLVDQAVSQVVLSRLAVQALDALAAIRGETRAAIIERLAVEAVERST